MVQNVKKVREVFAGRLDKIFIVFLLIVSLLAWLEHLSQSRRLAKKAEIRVFTDPPLRQLVDLPIDRALKVNGRLGPAIIEFRSTGEYRIASSTCPQGICVNYGWSRHGSIICVPNGIVVSSQNSENQIDAITR